MKTKSTFETCTLFFFIISATLALKQLRLPGNCLQDSALNQSKYQQDKVTPNPKCNLLISKESQLEYIDCPKPGVIRIVGEYDVVKIHCSASYPIDFNYDGTKPTEAIHVNFEREVKENSGGEILSFHVHASVFSIVALHRYYKQKYKRDVLQEISSFQYSRTGKYTFSGFEENSKFEKSFYIYFEEKLSLPSFIINREVSLPDSNSEILNIPCRPTHYDSQVSLLQNGLNLSKQQVFYSETDGFLLFKSVSERKDSYACELHHGEHFFRLNLTSSPSEASYECQGFHRDLNVDLTYEVTELFDELHETKVRCRFHCETCNENDVASLAGIGISNPAMDRLRQDFVLPDFRNRSYTVVENKTKKDINLEIKVGGIVEYAGAAFCGNNKQAKMASFGRILNGSIYPFQVGQDWSKVERESANIKFYISVWKNRGDEKLYNGEEIIFKCRLQTFVMSQPSRWILEWDNGTVVEYLDYNWDNGLSQFTIQLSKGLKNVYCAASMYHKSHWRNNSMELLVLSAITPFFDNEDNPVRSYHLNSINQFLECHASGDPKPKVSWEHNGEVTPSINTADVSLLHFPKITQGVAGIYECVACNIVNCSRKNFTVEVVPEKEISPGVIVTLIAVAVLGLMLFTALTTKSRNINGLTHEEVAEFRNGDKSIKSVMGSEYAHSQPFNKKYEISRSRYNIGGKIIGSGEFGVVLQGTLDEETVAVKTVKLGAGKQHLQYLLAEIKILSYLGYHENLVELIGADTQELDKGFAYIFLKYCALGNLEDYLRSNKINFKPTDKSYIKFHQMGKNLLTLDNLFNWSIQIAAAMEYLSEKKVIHGDLAARNVLITSDRIAKVSDFGLSRSRSYEYVKCAPKKSECSGPQPWRWVALEFFHYGPMHLSVATDVWSYGVLIWEIFSLGKLPYSRCCFNEDFVKELQNGMRLAPPEYGSDELYSSIMTCCWEKDPAKRPNFCEISQRLKEMNVKRKAGSVEMDSSRGITNLISYAKSTDHPVAGPNAPLSHWLLGTMHKVQTFETKS